MTRFLRFPDEARAISCMGDLYSVDLGWYAAPPMYIDVIGPIDDEGFHINVLGEVPDKALPFEVFPPTPWRVFAQ